MCCIPYDVIFCLCHPYAPSKNEDQDGVFTLVVAQPAHLQGRSISLRTPDWWVFTCCHAQPRPFFTEGAVPETFVFENVGPPDVHEQEACTLCCGGVSEFRDPAQLQQVTPERFAEMRYLILLQKNRREAAQTEWDSAREGTRLLWFASQRDARRQGYTLQEDGSIAPSRDPGLRWGHVPGRQDANGWAAPGSRYGEIAFVRKEDPNVLKFSTVAEFVQKRKAMVKRPSAGPSAGMALPGGATLGGAAAAPAAVSASTSTDSGSDASSSASSSASSEAPQQMEMAPAAPAAAPAAAPVLAEPAPAVPGAVGQPVIIVMPNGLQTYDGLQVAAAPDPTYNGFALPSAK